MSNSEKHDMVFDELRVAGIPSFDVIVKDPFRYNVEEFKVEVPETPGVVARLPPIFRVEIPVIDVKVEAELAPPSFDVWSSRFEDVMTSVPLITSDLIMYSDGVKEALNKELKSRKLSTIEIKPEKLVIVLKRPLPKTIPEEARDRYSIKVRVKRELTPELREILESRLTKEFRVTRMIKKMEIIRDERTLRELEEFLKQVAKKLKLHRLIGKSPS